jgi:hypothetical protein
MSDGATKVGLIAIRPLREIPEVRIPIIEARKLPEPEPTTTPTEAMLLRRYPVLSIMELLAVQTNIPKVDPKAKGREKTDQSWEQRIHIIRFCRRLLLQRIQGIPKDEPDEYLQRLFQDIQDVIHNTTITEEELSALRITIRLCTSDPSQIIISISTEEGKKVHEGNIVKPERWAKNTWYSSKES